MRALRVRRRGSGVGRGEAEARLEGERGKGLLRKRSEFLERSFAHCYATGGMRRVHLRGRLNILKRLLAHAAGSNLGLVMRKLFGAGMPRGLRALGRVLLSPAGGLVSLCRSVLVAAGGLRRVLGAKCVRPPISPQSALPHPMAA